MNLYNLKDSDEVVNFVQAVQKGLGKHQGLFFPQTLPVLQDMDALLAQDFHHRSTQVLSAFIGDEISYDRLFQRVNSAFSFPVPVVSVSEHIATLELFHGPTLAFKDFGARFMAQMLAEVAGNQPLTILTATSGDTGAAVAHAFYGLENIKVVILYPKGRISPLQEKLFCTLDKNIHTVAIESDFDACQALVKHSFDDEKLKNELHLNSANSINISRLLAQICYYFEAVAQCPQEQRKQLVVSVPSGNFGNLTAGLLAKALGLPIKRFIAATNANDTIPNYLRTGQWQPHATISTLSNSMDVSQPNNWPRIEELFKRMHWSLSDLASASIDDEITRQAIKALDAIGYLSEPHGAIAYQVLKNQLMPGEYGIFLGTAHPAKFKETMEDVLHRPIELPLALLERAELPILSQTLPADFAQLKQFLLSL